MDFISPSRRIPWPSQSTKATLIVNVPSRMYSRTIAWVPRTVNLLAVPDDVSPSCLETL